MTRPPTRWSPTSTPTTSGADPRGVQDSTAAIQSALWDCYDAGGGTVWLPAGTYRVTGTVEVPAFCTLRGDRRDPDRGAGDYGTVVRADLPPRRRRPGAVPDRRQRRRRRSARPAAAPRRCPAIRPGPASTSRAARSRRRPDRRPDTTAIFAPD